MASLEESLRLWRLHRECPQPSPSFAELYDTAREVRKIVAVQQADGRPSTEAEDLLRRIDKLCKGQLEQWRPSHKPT